MTTKEEEEDTFQKQLEQHKLKSYDDAHKNITELQECSLTKNNLSDIICRVRILIENQVSEPNIYMQKTFLHY
jgi:CRISPR/Cas system CSM-associated protein Csm2 small subunit